MLAVQVSLSLGELLIFANGRQVDGPQALNLAFEAVDALLPRSLCGGIVQVFQQGLRGLPPSFQLLLDQLQFHLGVPAVNLGGFQLVAPRLRRLIALVPLLLLLSEPRRLPLEVVPRR